MVSHGLRCVQCENGICAYRWRNSSAFEPSEFAKMECILYAGLIWGPMFVLEHIGFFAFRAVEYVPKTS